MMFKGAIPHRVALLRSWIRMRWAMRFDRSLANLTALDGDSDVRAPIPMIRESWLCRLGQMAAPKAADERLIWRAI
jgi:hypothetical protein